MEDHLRPLKSATSFAMSPTCQNILIRPLMSYWIRVRQKVHLFASLTNGFSGLLDAALSHGEIETGEDPNVKSILRELHRVLKDGGKYLLFSGNDGFITTPYFAGDEEIEWEFSDPIHIAGERAQRGNKTSRTVYFYVLQPRKNAHDTAY